MVTAKVANVAVAVVVHALPRLKEKKVPMSNVLRPVDTVIDTLARPAKVIIPSTARTVPVRLTVAIAKKALAKVAGVAKRRPMMPKLMKPLVTSLPIEREKKERASQPTARNVLIAEIASLKPWKRRRKRRKKLFLKKKSASLLMTISTSRLPNQLVSNWPDKLVLTKRLLSARLTTLRITVAINSHLPSTARSLAERPTPSSLARVLSF